MESSPVCQRSWCMWVVSLLARIMFVKTRFYPKIRDTMIQHSGIHFVYGWKEWVMIGVKQRRKKRLAKGINSNHPHNQQSGVHRTSPNNILKIQWKQSKTDIKKKTSFKKCNKVNETPIQSQLSMNRNNPSIMNNADFV